METLSSVQNKTTVQSIKNLINVIVELRGNGWKAREAPPRNIVNPYANGPIYDEFGSGPADVETYDMMNNQEALYAPFYPENNFAVPRY